MIKRIIIVSTLSMVLLLTLTVTLVMAQQGTTGPAFDPAGKHQNESDGLVNPDVNAPSRIPVQGRLTNAAGNPLTGSFEITFGLYLEATGGTAICSDTNIVDVSEGLFSSVIWGDCPGVVNGQQLYLGIQVTGDEEMSPRQPIFATPYALSLVPQAVISATVSGDAVLHIENSGVKRPWIARLCHIANRRKLWHRWCIPLTRWIWWLFLQQ